MRFTEIALCDSSPRRICEYLTNICAFDVKSVEETFTEDTGVVVGKILEVLSIEMESRKELAILFMREIRSNYGYGCDFKALILGRTARMFFLAHTEVGDRLAFSNGKIYPDSCFSKNTARYPYSTTYIIEIGPAEKDQVLLVRKQNYMNQPEIPVSSVEGNYPPIPEITAKLRYLENTVNSFIALGPSNGENTRPSRSGPSKKKNVCIIPDSVIISSEKSLGSKPEMASLSNSALVRPIKCNNNSKTKISTSYHKNNIGSCGIKAQGDLEIKKQQKPEQVIKISDTRKLNSNYVYDSIEKIKQISISGTKQVNLFGLVNLIIKPLAWTQKGKRHMICQLIDDSRDGVNLLVCHFFTADDNILKHVEWGDVLRLHRVKLEANKYEGVDGRVFNNNDILLFKSNSDIEIPIKTARVTQVTEAQKTRVKKLLDWYNDCEYLTEETDHHETERRTHIQNKSTNDSISNISDTNAMELISMANTSKSLKKNISNNIESQSKRSNEMKSKGPVVNNIQLKKRHLFVPKQNDHLSIACDISRITPVQTNKASVFIDKNLNISPISIESYTSAQQGFKTSTPKKGLINFKENKKIQKNDLQVKIPVTRFAEDQIGLSSCNTSNKQSLTSSIILTDSSDTPTVINETSRKRKQKRGNDGKPSFTKRKTILSDLHLNIDKEYPTIKNGEYFVKREVIERMQDDLEGGEDLGSSSLIELNNSSEVVDLLRGFNDQQRGGQCSPIPGSSQSSFNSSSIDDLLLLRPDQIAVKTYVTRITPDPGGEMLNLVSGFCLKGCHSFSVFTDLIFDDEEENVVAMCPICLKCRDLKIRVVLMFMLTFDLLDVKNGFKAGHVILCGHEASLSLGCSEEKFIKDENTRRAICKMLNYLPLDRDFGLSSELVGTHYIPKIFILSPDPVLKKLFMVKRSMQSIHENVINQE